MNTTKIWYILDKLKYALKEGEIRGGLSFLISLLFLLGFTWFLVLTDSFLFLLFGIPFTVFLTGAMMYLIDEIIKKLIGDKK